MNLYFILATATWTIALGAYVSVPKTVRDYAKVEVQRVQKRSVFDSPSYRASINGLGKQLELNLESPSYSIFTPNFQYLESSTHPETRTVQVRDATPSKQELELISQNFFTDTSSHAAVSLKRGATEQAFQISGRIDDDIAIIYKVDQELHEIIHTVFSLDWTHRNDYIDLNRTLTTRTSTFQGQSIATPEVFVIFDYENSRLFDHDRDRIIDYLGVFFHAVNNRFATAADPQISFRISGVAAISSPDEQPYMENNKVPDGYDINMVLDDLSYWLHANSGETKYDVAALITGSEMLAKDSKGNYVTGVAGLAYLTAACTSHSDRYWGSSVTEDRGGFFAGVFSVAHELAHNMGAPHDGEKGAESCPWSDGYIMSYEGWGTKNKFYFSSCSLALMKNLIDSEEGACTKTLEGSEVVPIPEDNVGDRVDMTELCIKATNSQEAVPDPETSADDLCKNLKCRYPTPDKPGYVSIRTLNRPPGDDSPCGNGGKCQNGDCVV